MFCRCRPSLVRTQRQLRDDDGTRVAAILLSLEPRDRRCGEYLHSDLFTEDVVSGFTAWLTASPAIRVEAVL